MGFFYFSGIVIYSLEGGCFEAGCLSDVYFVIPGLRIVNLHCYRLVSRFWLVVLLSGIPVLILLDVRAGLEVLYCIAGWELCILVGMNISTMAREGSSSAKFVCITSYGSI